MKKGKGSIVFLIIFLIVITIIYLVYSIEKKDKSSTTDGTNTSEKEVVVDNVVKRVSSRKEFYEARNCLNKFYVYCRDLNDYEDYTDSDESSESAEETIIDIIYNLLDYNYIKEYDITKDNLKEKLNGIKADSIQIDDMYVIQRKGDIVMYLVKATQLDKTKKQQEQYNAIVKIDKSKNTFSIYMNDYIEDNNYDKLNIDDEVEINLTSISKREDNIFNNPDYSISIYQEDLFDDFKMSCIYNVDRAYGLLSESTKKQKFKDNNSFSEYVSKNFLKFFLMEIEKCEEIQIDGNRAFYYETNKDIKFNIIEIAPMKYTVELVD